MTFLYIKVAGMVLFSWSEFGISHSTFFRFFIPLSDILQSTTSVHATFLQLHIFIIWSLCAVSTGIVNKYIYETCGCEPLTVIFQSSEISNFVDLRKNKMKEWVSNFGKCMRHRNVHREDTRFKDIVNRTCSKQFLGC